jgi:hypothetical protein
MLRLQCACSWPCPPMRRSHRVSVGHSRSRQRASVGPQNTGVKLRSGARVYPRRRGHEPAPPVQPFLPFETGCRRELRQLERLVRRLLPPAATVDTLPQHYHPHPQGPSGALIPAHHRVSTTRSPSRPVRCVFRQRAAREFASSHNPPPLLQGGCAPRGRRCQLHPFDIAGAVRRTLALSCEAVPASIRAGAGTSRRLRSSRAGRSRLGAGESFVSLNALFDDITATRKG